jgi:hypothetical protein
MTSCARCEHFYFRLAEPGYSEVTPGSDFSMSCNRNRWTFDTFEASREDFHRIMIAAEKCPDYKPTGVQI